MPTDKFRDLKSRPVQTDEFRPTARLETLQKRAEILDWIRQFFIQHRYWEVETPLLSQETVIDRTLEPFQVLTAGSRAETRFLQTSPEFAMKRLLADGAERIFQICKAFRQEEQGELHNPEFTMLEWYAVGETDQQQMDFTEELIRDLYRKTEQALPDQFERISYEQAFREVLGVSILDSDVEHLRQLVMQEFPERENHQSKSALPESKNESADRDDLLNLLLVEKIEPFLKQKKAVFLYDYPASQGALAKLSPEDPRVAKRFELYLSGFEICNGYHELTDAQEFIRRCETQNQLRLWDGFQALPESPLFFDAMSHGIPNCAGVALGIDRLVMLLLGCNALKDVLAFPYQRA